MRRPLGNVIVPGGIVIACSLYNAAAATLFVVVVVRVFTDETTVVLVREKYIVSGIMNDPGIPGEGLC